MLVDDKNGKIAKIEKIKYDEPANQVYIVFENYEYSLQELVKFNPSGLDLQLIKSIIF